MLLEILIVLSVLMVIWPMVSQSVSYAIRINHELKRTEHLIIRAFNKSQKNTIKAQNKIESLALCTEEIDSMEIVYVCKKEH